MSLDHKLLEIIACPLCKGKLHYDKDNQELICKVDKLAYAIDDGIPVLLSDKARELVGEELSR
ncbi:Trm112 family protein [Alginatibacterium sediminis]|uniref:Trm112 family protein n=1 Tax=Alginatibacterium sediminis TaxID=2164068 RepID=UPI0026BAE2A5